MLQFPDYSCDGYELVRWATSDTTIGRSDDKAYQDGDTYTSSTYAGLTLYARWEETASENDAVAYVEANGTGLVTGNTATYGGAISSAYQQDVPVVINGGTFTENHATDKGGAVYARTLTVSGGKIYGNTAGTYGDDIVRTGFAGQLNLISADSMGIDGVDSWLVDGYNLIKTDYRANAQQVVFDAGTISTKSGEIAALKAGELTDYLEVSVADNNLTNKLGDTVTWTVTVTNKSGSDKQVTLTNSLTGLGYKTLTPTLTDENGQTVSAVTVPGKGSVTLTASYTLPTSDSTFVGKTTTYSVTAKGERNKPSVTVKNADAKTVKADLIGITVELITEENKDSVPASVSGNSKVSDVYYPASLDEKVEVSSGVTLLYKITVTGDPYAWYNLSYDGATVVSGISKMSQLPASGEAVAYVTKTFTSPSTEGTLEYNPKVTTNGYTNICTPNSDSVVVNATSKAVTLGVSLSFLGDGATAWTMLAAGASSCPTPSRILRATRSLL